MELLPYLLVSGANKNHQKLMPRHVSSFRLTSFLPKHTLTMPFKNLK